uniref:Vacuolar protein sorting-associated protein 54 n=1 Tax=Elaeophora elaphi TaxID=1147741 RepID=A0A0R3RTR6_9BILA
MPYFTQNLSSVLLDPKRSRTEVQTFFTRHWGDSFVSKNRVSPALSLPVISCDHFKKYLETTAKKHRQCLKAKHELRRALARHEDDTRIDVDDVPVVCDSVMSEYYYILLDPHFSLADLSTFEAIFLEPVPGEVDRLQVSGKPYTAFLRRQPSGGGTSPTPSISEDSNSLQMQESYEAAHGRYFRPYDTLQQCLEFYHDLVDARLNNQLSLKSNAFWKTVVSCGSLSGELTDATKRVAVVRENLKKVDEKLYHQMTKIVNMYKIRQQREKVLQKLRDMACLRDAQLTVQMLLNQNDYPKALECIETAQDVLNNELRGVTCFRHLSPQLQELRKVIAKMLYEEFVTLIQKEMGRTCETENDAAYQGGHLNPIIIGLLQVKEYRFVHVLQQEIVVALKNSLRQIIKTHVVQNMSDQELAEFDPSLGNLSTHMRRLNFDQWFAALQHVLRVLYLMCRRVQNIQEVILDNIDNFSEIIARRSAEDQEITEEVGPIQESVEPSMLTSAVDDLSVPVQTTEADEEIAKLDTDDELELEIKHILMKDSLEMKNIPVLSSNKEKTTRNVQSQQSANFTKAESRQGNPSELGNIIPDMVMTTSVAATPSAFLSIPCRTIIQVKMSIAFLTEHTTYTAQERSCRLIAARSKDGFIERLSLSEFDSVMRAIEEFVSNCQTLIGSEKKFSSPLRLCVLQQGSSFVKKFHEDRKTKLSNILDTETWRAGDVPNHFQRLVDLCLQKNCLSDVGSLETGNSTEFKSNLLVDGESYVVVGTAFILLQIMAQYCDALAVLPEYASELLLCLVELLKNYNSRSCQLILGAGALQLIGLKSISVRHLVDFIALSSRCLQLILRFVPYIRTAFQEKLPADKQLLLRHVDQLVRDYNDHAQEIVNKLITVIDHHLVMQLQAVRPHNIGSQWDVKGSIPSPAFQQMCRQLGKFYNGLSGIMPENMIKDLFLRVHKNFKDNLKAQLAQMNITPHDSLTYGFLKLYDKDFDSSNQRWDLPKNFRLVSQEYMFFMKSLQAIPCCADVKDESINEALFSKN